jgi:hypothetical protein
MKLLLLFFCFSISYSQTVSDSIAIRATALNYVEGWYEGNETRMAAALHPDLAKRIVKAKKDSMGTTNVLEQMGAEQLINGTKRGFGKNTPKENQIKNVIILDIFQNTASVRAEMSGWIDYMHMAKWNGEWKIINVLWELKRKN